MEAAPIGIKFSCEYDALIDIDSKNFGISGTSASGEATRKGDLKDGFTLQLFKDEQQTKPADAHVEIGAPLYGDLKWSVTSAQTMVNFFVKTCHLEDSQENKKQSYVRIHVKQFSTRFHPYP